MKIPLNIDQNQKLVAFNFSTKSIVQIQRQYQRHFEIRKAQDRNTIWSIAKKFQNERTVITLIKRYLIEPEEPEFNRTLKMFICLLLRV